MTAADHHGDELHAAVRRALTGPLLEQLTVMLLDELRRELGGRRIYVTVRNSAYSAINPQRDEAVRRMFNGRNHREVMHHFDISRSTLYRIVGKRPPLR